MQTEIKEGKIQLVQLVEDYLQRIEEKKHLNAFVEVYAEEVKARAIEVQSKILSGKAGKLAGMILGIKDLIC
ncbi:MAG: amidase family protein, partial [Sphingobacteriaceae bacterium]